MVNLYVRSGEAIGYVVGIKQAFTIHEECSGGFSVADHDIDNGFNPGL